jgi:hypothetical protein
MKCLRYHWHWDVSVSCMHCGKTFGNERTFCQTRLKVSLPKLPWNIKRDTKFENVNKKTVTFDWLSCHHVTTRWVKDQFNWRNPFEISCTTLCILPKLSACTFGNWMTNPACSVSLFAIGNLGMDASHREIFDSVAVSLTALHADGLAQTDFNTSLTPIT